MAASAERIPRRILPVIVLAQFAGTSLWFASNAVMGDLQRQWQLPASALGTMTSAVQFGFIAGTLCFAWFAWAARFSDCGNSGVWAGAKKRRSSAAERRLGPTRQIAPDPDCAYQPSQTTRPWVQPPDSVIFFLAPLLLLTCTI